MGSSPLTIPPIRTALANNADGSPLASTSANGGPITTEKQWWFYWRDLGSQVNAGMTKLAGLITYGNHADRPVIESVPDGAIYVEIDRGNVIYQSLDGRWLYIAGTMYGTLTPDQRPADLGADDVGFDFRTNVTPSQEFLWSGGRWIEVTPIRYGTHAQRLAAVIANLWSGMLWMETDRGSVIYQNQGGVWLYLAGTMWGTLVPDQRPTDLGVHDAGFDFRTTVAPSQEFIWNQTAWVETTSVTGAVNLTHPNVVTKVGSTTGQIVEGGITDASPGNSGAIQISSAGNVAIGISPLPRKFLVHQGTDQNLAVTNPAFIAGAIALIGVNDANTLNIPIEYRATRHYFGTGTIEMPTLPSANPGVGTKQLWYDPADSNRVKFAP